ncbi:hypothetical protein KSF81_18405 [Siccirubricoccus sp. G192]|nr:hypothetical protein [Siccirubricoccus sp. G192]
MTDSNYNVGDLVAEFLSRIGVTTCFGIVSVHNIPMLDGIGRRNAIRYVMARGEMGGRAYGGCVCPHLRPSRRDVLLHRAGGREYRAGAGGGAIRGQPGAAHHRPDGNEVHRPRHGHGA